MEEWINDCAVKKGRTRGAIVVPDVREGCSGWRNIPLLSRANKVVCSSLELALTQLWNMLLS